jgi:competence protein ComEC
MENYRKVSPLYLLGVAMLITILLNKFNLSAVLSFLAVLGIITTLTEKENRILKTIKVSLAPMLFTLPVILYQFGTVNVISFLTSIIAELLFTPFLIATFISNLTGWHFNFLNKLTESLGFIFLKLEQILFLLSKSFVTYNKITLTASAITILITLLLIIFEKQKFQLIPATLLLIFAIVTQHHTTGKKLEIPGWKLNSFFFLSTEGQKYENCKIISNYVFPYSRKILHRNTLIDKRVEGRKPSTHK